MSSEHKKSRGRKLPARPAVRQTSAVEPEPPQPQPARWPQELSEGQRAEQDVVLLNFALNNVREAAFLIDEQARFHFVNEESCRILGYTRAELLSLSVSDIDPDFPLERWREHWSDLQTQRSLTFEGRHQTKDGCLIPVEINANYFEHNGQGYNLALARDITERQQVERQLLASEHLFRALVENSPDFIARYDREFRRIYVNPAIQKLFAGPAESVLGQTPLDQSPLYAPPVYIDHLRQAIETAAENTVEMPFRTAQGEMHWGRMRFIPEFGPDGQVASVLAVGHDIHNIKENERRFRMLAENFPDFVARFDREGRYTYVNSAVEKAFSLSADAIIGKTLAELPQRRGPEEIDEFLALIVRTFTEGVPHEFETRWQTDQGRRIFEVRHAPEKDATGNVVSVLCLARDITARKQAEQEHLAHLHFYESLDRVNRAMRGTNDLEQMMSDVLDLLLSIFECDRAWVVYPCDPEAASWQVSMERTRPEYPGALLIGVELPLDPAGAAVYRILRDAPGPVQFNPAAAHPVPIKMAQDSGVQSFIALALYPKVGQPWSFGLHQCSYPRTWTPEEERLFQEIGRRLSDGLTSLLMLRNLQERERHSQSLLRLSKALESAQTYNQVVKAALEEVKVSLGYQNLWVYLLTEDKRQATALVAGGHMSKMVMSGEGIATLTVEGDPMLEAIAAATEIVVIEDAQRDERTNKEVVARLGNRTIVNVPIQLFDRHLGSVGVGTFGAEGVRVPSESETEYLRALASHLAVTLDRIQLLEQREQAAETLTHERNLLRTLIDHIPDFIYIKDVESRFLIANASVAQHMGAASPAQLVGRTDWDFYPPERAAQFYADERALMQSGKPLLRHDEPNADTAGNLRWIMTTKLPMRDSHGQIIGLVGIGHDLTERKQAEQERQAHLRFLASMDQINRAIQGTNNLEQMMSDVLDVVLSIFDCDRAFLMYPCDPEAASWTSPMERTKPEYPGVLAWGMELPMAPGVVETVRLVLNSDGPVKFGPGTEHPLPTNVTETFNIKSYMSTALYPKVGKPWQFGIHQCSYARVWTQEEEQLLREIGWRLSDALTSVLTLRNLQESEAKFSTSFRSSPSALSVSTAKDHVYVDVNDSFLEWTGYTRAEVIGHTSVELQLWAEPDQNREFRRLLHEDGSVYNFEYAYHRKDGEVRYALVSATFITLGGERCVLAQSNDITDRKRAEETLTSTHLLLQQNLRFTEALLSAIPTPVFYKDREGRYLGCNRAFSEIMGVTSEAIKGKTVFELWPGEHAHVYHAKDLELMNNPNRQVYEFRVRDKDGLERPVVYVKDVFRAEDDQVAGIVGAFLDITERKQAEEALRRLNRELRAISDCNQTLLRAVDEQTLLDDICRIVCDEAGYRMAWVGYAESDESRTVRPVAWAGVEDGYLAQANITWADTERGHGPTGTAIRNGESAFIQDFMTDPQAAPWRENALQRGYRSNIALPLKDESAKTFGALTIYATDPNAFTPDEMRLLEELAGDLAFGITTLRTRAERRRAEMALWESSQMLQLVLDNMPAYVFWKDRNSAYLGCNNRFAANAGLSSPQAIVGLTDFDLPWRDSEAQSYQADDRQVMETGLPKLNYEETQLTAAGRLAAVHTSKIPLRNPAGDIIGVLGTFEDITERKQAEEALRESQALYRSFIEQLPTPVFRKDRAGRYVMVNSKFCQIKGLRAADFLGRKPSEVARRELARQGTRGQAVKYAAQGEELHELIMQTGEVLVMEEEHLGADGRTHYMHVIRMPVFDAEGKIVGTQGIQFDISERKRAEEEVYTLNQELEHRVISRTAELARAHEHLRAILDTAGEGVVFTDFHGTIEYINPAMERLTGYQATEVIGRNPRLWRSNRTPAAAHRQMWSALTSGEIWQGELINRRKDGTLYDAALTAAPLTDPKGQIMGFVGVQRDITRQKELDRLKDQFVSNVSHELRTPLANILLHVGLLEHGKPDKLPSYLQTLRREAERLRKLIEDLLDLSRLDRNVAPIQLVPVELNQLLEQLVTDRVALAEQRGLKLTYDRTPDLPLALSDASQLIQVASNLLTNALNYTPAGGTISVWAEARQPEGQKMVAVTVRDTGPGISAQDVPHLFERFYRGAAGRRASAPGTGLGLAISHEIMKRLGGRITVESEVGRGAAFTVWLPIV